jgi:hypothetical protein
MIFKRALLKAAIFHLAFGTAFFLTYFLTPDPPRRVTRQATPPPRVFDLVTDLSAEADLIMLDRANKRIYARLSLLRHSSLPMPEPLRARAYFFLPADPARRVWASPRVEIHEPFAGDFSASVSLAMPCGEACDERDVPPGVLFARVQLFAENSETPLPQGDGFFDVMTAMPVLVVNGGGGREPGR